MKYFMFFAIITCAAAQTPAAKQAIAAVRGLNATPDPVADDLVGYQLRVDAAKAKVDRYLATPVKNDADLRRKLKSALNAHVAAGELSVPAHREQGAEIVLADETLQSCREIKLAVSTARYMAERDHPPAPVQPKSAAYFLGAQLVVDARPLWRCSTELTSALN
jgi:hypothetical protein